MIIPKIITSSKHVADHYNNLDELYRKFWGEHLHHGFWNSGQESVEEAVIHLVEKIVVNSRLKRGAEICDLGCGYGATSSLLAEKWDANVTGVTVSSAQYLFAKNRYSDLKNLNFHLADWLKNPFSSSSFDMVLSIESSEHMVDKPKFFQEAFRVLRPDGTICICAWLANEAPKKWQENYLLEPICREGRLPSMGSAQEYKNWLADAGFSQISFEDLTQKVKRTWSICIGRVLKAFLLDSHMRRLFLSKKMKEREFLKTLFRIFFAYECGAMKYGLFCAKKK